MVRPYPTGPRSNPTRPSRPRPRPRRPPPRTDGHDRVLHRATTLVALPQARLGHVPREDVRGPHGAHLRTRGAARRERAAEPAAHHQRRHDLPQQRPEPQPDRQGEREWALFPARVVALPVFRVLSGFDFLTSTF